LFVVHAAVHWFVARSQTGAATPQSVFAAQATHESGVPAQSGAWGVQPGRGVIVLVAMQATQVELIGSHTGAIGSMQSLLDMQPTQVCVIVLQTGVRPRPPRLQLALSVHPTQCIVIMSQAGVGSAHIELIVHAGQLAPLHTQRWAIMSQNGVLPPQSAFVAQ
jgi:hypothetical protein